MNNNIQTSRSARHSLRCCVWWQWHWCALFNVVVLCIVSFVWISIEMPFSLRQSIDIDNDNTPFTYSFSQNINSHSLSTSLSLFLDFPIRSFHSTVPKYIMDNPQDFSLSPSHSQCFNDSIGNSVKFPFVSSSVCMSSEFCGNSLPPFGRPFVDSKFIGSLGEMISHVTFRDLSEYVSQFNWDFYKEKIHQKSLEELLIQKCLPQGVFIFSSTGQPFERFCSEEFPLLLLYNHSFTLLTANSDDPPNPLHCPSLLNSSLLLRWYSINVDIVHPKMIVIPEGINQREHSKSLLQFVGQRFLKLRNLSSLSAFPSDGIFAQNQCDLLGGRLSSLLGMDLFVFSAETRRQHLLAIKDPFGYHFPENQIPPHGDAPSVLLLVNFGMTHKSRTVIFKHFCQSPSLFPWVSCSPKAFNPQVDRIDWRLVTLYDHLSQIPFWLCPRGNGLDTHRLWEALYVGAIPVIESSSLDELFLDGDLPAIIVDDLRNVSESLLRSHWRRFRNVERDFPRRKLLKSYWTERIRLDRHMALTEEFNSFDRFQRNQKRTKCWKQM